MRGMFTIKREALRAKSKYRATVRVLYFPPFSVALFWPVVTSARLCESHDSRRCLMRTVCAVSQEDHEDLLPGFIWIVWRSSAPRSHGILINGSLCDDMTPDGVMLSVVWVLFWRPSPGALHLAQTWVCKGLKCVRNALPVRPAFYIGSISVSGSVWRLRLQSRFWAQCI